MTSWREAADPVLRWRGAVPVQTDPGWVGRHPGTPLVIMSMILAPDREAVPGPSGPTIAACRELIHRAVELHPVFADRFRAAQPRRAAADRSACVWDYQHKLGPG